MPKILLPVDGSPGVHRLVEHVVGHGRDHELTEIHLLNVQPPILTGEVTYSSTVEMVSRARQGAGEAVLRPVQELLDADRVPWTAQIVLGDPADTIVRYAAERDCDSIVMGTRGMGPIGNLVLGSVATKVVRRANVPVTLVKRIPGGRDRALAFARGEVRGVGASGRTRRSGRRMETVAPGSANSTNCLPDCRAGSFNDACRLSRKVEALGLV